MAIRSSHPLGRIVIEAVRELGWSVTNAGEAEVAQQLEALGYGSADIETQFKAGPYRLDFAIPATRTGIEADGWVHTARGAAERDERRDRWLSEKGWTIIRIDTDSGDIGEQLRRHLPEKQRLRRDDYPSSRMLPGITARLMSEDWHEMTSAANASRNHVSSDDRWTSKAAEANPALDDDQAYRLGQMLKKQHYTRMGKLSAEARHRKASAT